MVYRETMVDKSVGEPTFLAVEFRLRLIRGTFGHWLFRRESMLNTPLFVGFPGFVSKLWMTHDEHRSYRGLYQWDGAAQAIHYARCLWWVLALVCQPGSIRYQVVPGAWRDQVVEGVPPQRGKTERLAEQWWRPAARGPETASSQAGGGTRTSSVTAWSSPVMATPGGRSLPWGAR